MCQNLTELVFILDRSGSMSGLEQDTIGGFNSMIEKQKGVEGEALVSTVLFDNEMEVIHDRVKLSDIPKLTKKEYFTRGSTALLDAIGHSIKHIENIYKYAREEDIPEKTLFMITTDGYENSSREFRYEDVKKLINDKKTKSNWDFVFIGANIDAVNEASKFGISKDYAMNYMCDSEGTDILYGAMAGSIGQYRKAKNKLCMRRAISATKNTLEKDLKKRSKKS